MPAGQAKYVLVYASSSYWKSVDRREIGVTCSAAAKLIKNESVDSTYFRSRFLLDLILARFKFEIHSYTRCVLRRYWRKIFAHFCRIVLTPEKSK